MAAPIARRAGAWGIAFVILLFALFVVTALFLGVVGGRRSLPGWIRLLCGVVAILCVIRAVMGALTVFTIFDVIAPVAFLIAVVVLAILAWRQPIA